MLDELIENKYHASSINDIRDYKFKKMRTSTDK